MLENDYWQAVLDHDAHYDGEFVYAVRTTGVYCRPACPSRRPLRQNAQFFDTPALAEEGGFRACQRCHPNAISLPEPHLDLVQEICRALEMEMEHPPTLNALAEQFHLSPYHLQRTFKRIVGVTPRQYAAAQRIERLKSHLKNGNSVTDAVYEAGYQSSSSVYQQAADQLGMAPARYQRGGIAERISYTVVRCSLGSLLVATTEKGICSVRLGDSETELTMTLYDEFPAATIQRQDADLAEYVAVLLSYLDGERPHLDLPLDVQATAFQQRVWEALRMIPYGSTRSYREVAEAIGKPTAVRAVAQACGANSAALVIPCHRVVREDGSLGGYRWGVERKQTLLAKESGQFKLLLDNGN